MRKVFQDHGLTIVLGVILFIVLALGTWATWQEFVANEQAGKDAAFLSWTFAAYWAMQITMNFAPEIMGLILILVLTKHLRERFSAEAPARDE